jgi:magnesium chelatase family protein
VIEALREPLENGDITIARAEELVTLPARGIVVLACNPCPCGLYGLPGRTHLCECRETTRRDYRRRMSGPVIDRIDITRHLSVLAGGVGPDPFEQRESSADVRLRVEAARERQARRYADAGWRLNGQAPGAALRERWPLPPAGQQLVEGEVVAGRLTRRGGVRVHRLAWTVADLAEVNAPGRHEVDVALRLRTGTALESHTVLTGRAG